MTKEYSFTGVIKRIKFHNPLNGYGIISVEIFDNKDFRTSNRKPVLPTLSVLQSGSFQIGVS